MKGRTPETLAEGGVGSYRIRDVCTNYLTGIYECFLWQVPGKLVSKSS